MPDKDYLEQCLQEWEDLLQQELISTTGDKTAKLSHYFTVSEDCCTYVWYSTKSHPKTDLVEIIYVC